MKGTRIQAQLKIIGKLCWENKKKKRKEDKEKKRKEEKEREKKREKEL